MARACSQCMAAATDDAAFCPNCGAPLAAAPPSRPAASSPDAAADIDALLKSAHLARLRGGYSEAIDRCVEVLRADPANRTAHSLLADTYREQGRLEDAIRWYGMALELGPSRSDSDHLQALERLQRRKRTVAPAATAPPESGGTQALAGLSPRRWLRGITAVSVGFLAVMIVALVATQSGRRRESPVARPLQLSPASAALLPDRFAGAEASPASSSAQLPERVLGGTGFPSDPGTPAPKLPTPPKAGTPDAAAPPAALPPAPVLAVKPIEPPASQPAGQSTADVQAAGWQISSVQANPDGRSAAVTVDGPQPAGDARPDALRAAVRAAKTVFASYPQLDRADLHVEVAAGQGATLKEILSASLDRHAAESADAETETPDALEQRLSGVQWHTGD